MLDVCVKNLGKLEEGEDIYKWLELPCGEEAINDLFVEIGIGYYNLKNEYVHGLEIDGVYYGRYIIEDYETNIPIEIGYTEDLTKLNKIAEFFQFANSEKLSYVKQFFKEANEDEMEKFNAVYNTHFITIQDIDVRNDIEKFLYNFLIIKVGSENPYYDLGQFYLNECERPCDGSFSSLLGELDEFFDYSKYGRSLDFVYDEVTGYMVKNLIS